MPNVSQFAIWRKARDGQSSSIAMARMMSRARRMVSGDGGLYRRSLEVRYQGQSRRRSRKSGRRRVNVCFWGMSGGTEPTLDSVANSHKQTHPAPRERSVSGTSRCRRWEWVTASEADTRGCNCPAKRTKTILRDLRNGSTATRDRGVRAAPRR